MGIKEVIGSSDMAKWDGDFHFTIDDRSLLRAIYAVDGSEDELPPVASPGEPSIAPSVMHRFIMDKPGFKIIKDNDHLRALLRAFLEANIRVADDRELLKSELDRSFVTRWLRKPVIRNLEAGVKDLEAKRDEAFKKYEMLRRLTDWENVLLKRLPA